jgi:predicted aminopeptidase
MSHNCRMPALSTPKTVVMRSPVGSLVRFIVLALGIPALLAGCADTRYYWQSVSGHVQLMQASRPVTRWLEDPDAAPPLKRQLLLSQRIRDFSVTELALPDNASYRRYADLGRPAVVWNVVAAPKLSLTLHTWCFPVLGCVSYRGYFDEADARREAEQLQGAGPGNHGVRCARLLDAGMDELGRRRPAAQYLHCLSRR